MPAAPDSPTRDAFAALAAAARALLAALGLAVPAAVRADIRRLIDAARLLVVSLALTLTPRRGHAGAPPPPPPLRSQRPRTPAWRNPPLAARPSVETKSRPRDPAPRRPPPHPSAALVALLALCADPMTYARKLARRLANAAREGVARTPPALQSHPHTDQSRALLRRAERAYAAFLRLDTG